MTIIAIEQCADPVSFVRGGPTLTTYFFIVYKGRYHQNTTTQQAHDAESTLIQRHQR